MSQQYYMTESVDPAGHNMMSVALPPASRPYGYRTSSRRQPVQSVPSTPEYESYAEGMRCRTATVAAVNAWVSNVQPGSPAPISPPKDASFAGYPYHRSAHRESSPSGSDSRSSASSSSHSLTRQVPEMKSDSLPSTGYAPIFVAFPNGAPPAHGNPVPEVPRESGRHRSVSLKPSKSRPVTAEPRPTKEKKEKKSKQVDMDVILAADLAMAQLLGGGTLEHHAKQQAKARAKIEAAKLNDNRRPSTSSQDSDLDDAGTHWNRRGREHHRPPPLNLAPPAPVDVSVEPKKSGKFKSLLSAVTGKKSTRS